MTNTYFEHFSMIKTMIKLYQLFFLLYDAVTKGQAAQTSFYITASFTFSQEYVVQLGNWVLAVNSKITPTRFFLIFYLVQIPLCCNNGYSSWGHPVLSVQKTNLGSWTKTSLNDWIHHLLSWRTNHNTGKSLNHFYCQTHCTVQTLHHSSWYS